jgi:PAS domain S-box-containing protein
MNLDGIITSWNKGAERVFGYTAEEAIGQPITIVIPQARHDEEREI